MKGLRTSMRFFTYFFTFLCCFLFISTSYSSSFGQTPKDDEAYKKGEGVFKSNCASCHKIHERLTGPALAGVYDKYDKEWLYNWIHNSQALVKAGDPQAVKIFEEFNKSVMTAFPSLPNADIDAVLQYIKAETESPTVASAPAAAAGGAAQSSSNNIYLLFLGVIVAVLFTIIYLLANVNKQLSNLLKEKMGWIIPEGTSFGDLITSKKTIALISMLSIVCLGYYTVDSAQKLGRQQGYAPSQPIKFSHKLHAGVNKIDCQYCHIGASRGKSAVIPSPNLCMNCHKAIKKGPEHGETEISKIYAAVGWDAEKQKYIEGYEEKPIEWVRIHNLPDHVYFNHSQHVVAGGVECQKCHGKVEEMDKLEQYSSLGMGWCVNCHRTTEVKLKDNDFYKNYEVLHEKFKKGKKVTVEDIGGIECQKCHY